MKQFSRFETAQIRTGAVFDQLPKGAYVIKIKKAEECDNKNGKGSHIKVAFDIAEGEYKDFYQKQFDAVTAEDKHWPYDAVHNLPAPDNDSPQWMINSFGTFIAALEDSNDGYHWDWNEAKWKGLVLGALFRIEQSENNGTVYDHTRPFWFRKAQDVRDGKFGRLPKDKLVEAKKPSPDELMSVSESEESEIPW